MPTIHPLEFYNKFVKPIYVEIEARGNSLPVELLFETHSALDHLSRAHCNNGNSDRHYEKALSHLKRGTLDAFKLKLKYYYEDLRRFEKTKIDLTLIDNGVFYRDYSQLQSDIRKTAKKARLEEKRIESEEKLEDAFNDWMQVSIYIDRMEDDFLHSPKITWARKKTFKIFTISTIVALILGYFAGVASNYTWSKICQFFNPQTTQTPPQKH
jgi:hypothetical protein